MLGACEEFKLDLIDGFAGGGIFLDGTAEVSGTPLVMIEETTEASSGLNQKRTKRLRIRCRFYFVDTDIGESRRSQTLLSVAPSLLNCANLASIIRPASRGGY